MLYIHYLNQDLDLIYNIYHFYYNRIVIVNTYYVSCKNFNKKLGVSHPSVCISVKRGEMIAKAKQLEFVKE